MIQTTLFEKALIKYGNPWIPMIERWNEVKLKGKTK